MNMVKNIDKIAAGLGARVVRKVPQTGGGAFGAARLAHIAGDSSHLRGGSESLVAGFCAQQSGLG
jgi:hypothetical protein